MNPVRDRKLGNATSILEILLGWGKPSTQPARKNVQPCGIQQEGEEEEIEEGQDVATSDKYVSEEQSSIKFVQSSTS
jgi:hypothetical protein